MSSRIWYDPQESARQLELVGLENRTVRKALSLYSFHEFTSDDQKIRDQIYYCLINGSRYNYVH